LGHFINQVDVLRGAKSFIESGQHLFQPSGSLAAGNAPAAAFVLVELHDAQHRSDHIGILVHHDYASGPEHALRLHQRVVIHSEVAFIRLQHRARAPAGNYGL
jgi:hypothetical protein